MKHITIGLGEVGTAINNVFGGAWVDQDTQNPVPWYEDSDDGIMHVRLPFNENFVRQVLDYDTQFEPSFIVIHSTVPVGTTNKISGETSIPVMHSPIRGLHPHLYEGIMTFPKFIGGMGTHYIADEFRRAGLKVVLFEAAEATELAKLLDTEYYRACIEFTLEAKQKCRDYNVSFHEAYTLFNQTYNEGYIKLGHPEFVRPVLQAIEKPIGGHCVLSNKELLAGNFPQQITTPTHSSEPLDDLPF